MSPIDSSFKPETPSLATTNPTTSHSPPPRRWRRRLFTLIVALGILVVFHAPILRGIAGILLVDDSRPSHASLVLLDGDRRHDRAAALFREGTVRQVLLVDRVPERVVLLKLTPPRSEMDRKKLRTLDVPDADITVLPGQAENDWDRARILGAWLRDHPQEQILILCDRFDGRRLRIILRRVLGSDSQRIVLHSLPHRDYDETNWWSHKDGLLEVFNAFLALTYTSLNNEDGPYKPRWNPDTYEESLR